MKNAKFLSLVFISFTVLFAAGAYASEWPCYGGNDSHSFVSDETIGSNLNEQWRFIGIQEPQPAWPEPARQDFWHNVRTITASVTYDRAFEPVIAEGKLYFGSSSDDKLRCLNAETGKPLWEFYSEGPIRLSPVLHKDKIYFGSDDGCVYCLNAETGSMVWKHRCTEEDFRIAGNERIISLWPVRTGVYIKDDILYTTSGIFPNQGVFVHAVDADSGITFWKQKAEFSPQGYLLSMNGNLIIPGSRTEPAAYDILTGDFKGKIEGAGGYFTLVSDGIVVNGPGRREGKLTLFDSRTKTTIASFEGIRMIVKDEHAYLLSHNDVTAVNRSKYNAFCKKIAELKHSKEQIEKSGVKDDEKIKKLNMRIDHFEDQKQYCIEWKQVLPSAYSMLLTADTLLIGGKDTVMGLELDEGRKKWQKQVKGDVYSLAVSQGRMYASTDHGVIHCFAPKKNNNPAVIDENKKIRIKYENTSAENIAKNIVNAAGIIKGYCLVTGLINADIVKALAQQTEMKIVAVTGDKNTADNCRRILSESGIYGRAAVIHKEDNSLPFANLFFNLITDESSLLKDTEPEAAFGEIYKKLRPCGGTYYLTSAMKRSVPSDVLTKYGDIDVKKHADHILIVRKALPGTGQWTQLYADAGHTACSGDPAKGPFRLQWFGKPGAKPMIDRHHRPMSSLYCDGRLFVPADNAVIAVDAYNGSKLWEKKVPNSRRVAALKNSGHMLIEGRHFYITAEDTCYVYDVEDGGELESYTLPGSPKGRDWGYLNFYEGKLIGTIQKKGASFSDLAFQNSPLNGSRLMEGDFREVVISESLFVINVNANDKDWTYKGSSIMNNAITVCDGKIFIAETPNTKMSGDSDGRVRIDHFCEDLKITAIDINTGTKVWQKPYDLPFQHIMFINTADNTLLASGTYNEGGKVYYEMFAFEAKTGKELWNNRFMALNIRATGPSPLDGTHGEQWQHPVINGDTVYLRPYAFDLRTGKKKEYIARRGGHGCGGFTASQHYLFGRGDNPRAYPLEVKETDGERLTACTRPGCWLNIIPAGGLVMIPESSSGCTCGYSLQTSVVFAPKYQ